MKKMRFQRSGGLGRLISVSVFRTALQGRLKLTGMVTSCPGQAFAPQPHYPSVLEGTQEDRDRGALEMFSEDKTLDLH